MKEGDLIAGRYRLLRRIGAGAMGTVWAARHEILGRDLALKICAAGKPGGRSSRDARERFLREARIVGGLRHPNVVDIADAGDAGADGLYLAMELLEGESLAERITHGILGPGDALAVAAELCRGLAAAHAAGVVHRDLKPENVFLARGPTGGVVPKLLDFGVSLSRGGRLDGGAPQPPDADEALFGTPAYMSPEQALGEAGIDRRTDVWALGVVLHEMLTGRLPFQAESYPALLPEIIERPYPPLPASIPAEVAAVVAGCLAKDRGDRYASAEALLAAIDRALASLPTAEPASVRSGFFVETGRSGAPFARVAAKAPPTARIGLAIAILAVPIAIGVAAVATRAVGAPAAMTTRASSVPAAAPAPDPSVAPPVASGLATEPTAIATASAAPPSTIPRPPGRAVPATKPRSRVTGVNSAGF